MWENLTVKGFSFESAAEYSEAKHEAESIDYICSRMDADNPEIALKIYTKLLERNNLHTIVGISFLKVLRDRITAAGICSDEELRSIHAPVLVFSDVTLDTGDENALERDNISSESADNIEGAMPAEDDDNPTEMRRLNRDINMYREREKKLKTVAEHYRTLSRSLIIIAAALAVIVAALLGLSIYNNNLEVKDAEIAIQDKYAAWEEELEAREALIKQYEELQNVN